MKVPLIMTASTMPMTKLRGVLVLVHEVAQHAEHGGDQHVLDAAAGGVGATKHTDSTIGTIRFAAATAGGAPATA